MAWTAFTAAERPLSAGDVLEAAHLNKISANLLASGVPQITGNGDILYYGGDATATNPMKLLKLTDGSQNSLVQVLNANTLHWSQIAQTNVSQFVDQPGRTSSISNDASLPEATLLPLLRAFSGQVEEVYMWNAPTVGWRTTGVGPGTLRVNTREFSGNFGNTPNLATSNYLSIISPETGVRRFNWVGDYGEVARVLAVYLGYYPIAIFMDIAAGSLLPITDFDLHHGEVLFDRTTHELLNRYSISDLENNTLTVRYAHSVPQQGGAVLLFVLRKNIGSNATIPPVPIANSLNITGRNNGAVVGWNISSTLRSLVSSIEVRYRLPFVTGGTDTDWTTVTGLGSTARSYSIASTDVQTGTFNSTHVFARMARILQVQVRTVNSAGTGVFYNSGWSNSIWVHV